MTQFAQQITGAKLFWLFCFGSFKYQIHKNAVTAVTLGVVTWRSARRRT